MDHLREAVRPEEGRGSLSAEELSAVKRFEDQLRPELAKLHSALEPQVERIEAETAPTGWTGFDTNQKLAAAGIAVTAFGIVIGAVVAIIVAG